MKEFNKKLAVLIITFITIPFLIIGLLHLVNFLGTKFGIDLNPSGIDNAVWFAFLGSFLGGICTLVAVLYTLRDNKKALDQSQRQIIYQAEMQNIENELKIIANSITQLEPFSIFSYFSNLTTLLATDYNLRDARDLINKIQNFGGKLDSQYNYIIGATDIMNQCHEICDTADDCVFCFGQKSFTKLYDYMYKKESFLLSEMIEFIDTTNRNELIFQSIQDDETRSKFDSEYKSKILEKIQNISKNIEHYRAEYPEIVSKLLWAAKDYTAMNKIEAREHLYGRSLHICKDIILADNNDYTIKMRQKYSKEIDEILKNNK